MKLHIGLDDTDSPEGGCTTYIASLLAERLLQFGAEFLDYPTLLRLNPNTPWKTRGNAAVCLRVELDEASVSKARKETLGLVTRYGEFECENTNPGVVFHVGEVPRDVTVFSGRVVREIVDKVDAEALIRDHGMDSVTWKNGRGIIGALAAIGGTLDSDHTFELITYRAPENWSTKRRVDPDSVRRMNEALADSTYNNVDKRGRPLITPHGPDPVLYGVRGESPGAVYHAFNMIEELEPVARWMIYRSNQGTDAHYSDPVSVGSVKAFNPAVVEGWVESQPKVLRGGHVIFSISDESGVVDCAAYEPTGRFRETVKALVPGDRVRVGAGVRQMDEGLTLNLERLDVLELVEVSRLVNPRCPECGGSTESMGRDQGFRCKKCGFRGDSLMKVAVKVPRMLDVGVYLPDRGAHRHLTKPLERYGREKVFVSGPLHVPWIG
ncbi:MAG: tRNA(Ile)(2)-agmatinylcytidine synthase [Candidatus Bathyarchaeota archaeon]|nr:tRNA(Ile)(2)-agmatinylcytidine synthase [Candidatus Bathyarchaeota archaeon]